MFQTHRNIRRFLVPKAFCSNIVETAMMIVSHSEANVFRLPSLLFEMGIADEKDTHINTRYFNSFAVYGYR